MKNVIITILAILVIALGGFVIYDKCFSKEKMQNNYTNTNGSSDSNVTEDIKCENNCSLDKISTINKVDFTSDYANFQYKKDNSTLEINFYTENIKDNFNVLTKTPDDVYELSLKKAVRNFGAFSVGQADNYNLVIVYEDGTVDTLLFVVDFVGNENNVRGVEINELKSVEGIHNALSVYESNDFDSLSGSRGYDFLYFNN